MADWSAVAAEVAAKLDRWQALPVIPTWSRLEPMPLTRGDLTPGVQALVADPLWLLGRQWQYDELRGEDGGSPVLATVEGETVGFSRFRAGLAEDGTTVDLDPPDAVGALPLEVRVEAERPPVLPLRLRTALGLHLLRLLRAAGLPAVAAAAVAEFPPPAAPAGLDDPAGAARFRLAAGRVPDGAAVLAALASGVPAALTAAAGAGAAKAGDVLSAWQGWAATVLAAPTGTSWNPHRLEHAFRAQADLAGGPTVLEVAEYTGGTLDWFHGDLAAGPDLGAAAAGPPPVAVRDTTLPAPVRFAGMPSDRLFAFEDSAVYLGGVSAGRTDLARLAVVEFAMAYGVDWFQVPLLLPYGSATRLDRVRVRDTFGVELEIPPAREATSPGWTAFQCTPVTDNSRLADVFVLAATVPQVLEGLPVEEVALFRDEMANLVWGVERIVPGPISGEPVARARQAARVSLRQAVPEDLGDARIIYRLMTPVPENWIPLVAVREGPTRVRSRPVLERRPMLRFAADGTPELVNPMGTVLLSDPAADPATDRLRIAEEEVPREGVVVTRAFQLARTVGGGTVLWLGRRVRTGQGEGASGLRFDTALPPGT